MFRCLQYFGIIRLYEVCLKTNETVYYASSMYNRNLRFTLQCSVLFWVCIIAISALYDN